MGFFDHLQKGGAFSLQAHKPQIRKVVQARPAPPSRSTSAHNFSNGNARSRNPSAENGKKANGVKSRSVSTDTDTRASSKRRLGTPSGSRKRPTPELRLSSDDDDDDDDDATGTDTSFDVRKRVKLSDDTEVDPERRLRSLRAFSEEGAESFSMVHAAEIASSKKSGVYKRAFNGGDKPSDISLQYPSVSRKEKYGFSQRTINYSLLVY